MATPNLLSPSLPQKAVINSVPQGQVSDNLLPELRRHFSIHDEFSLTAGLDWQFCSFAVLQFYSFLDGKNSDSIFKRIHPHKTPDSYRFDSRKAIFFKKKKGNVT